MFRKRDMTSINKNSRFKVVIDDPFDKVSEEIIVDFLLNPARTQKEKDKYLQKILNDERGINLLTDSFLLVCETLKEWRSKTPAYANNPPQQKIITENMPFIEKYESVQMSLVDVIGLAVLEERFPDMDMSGRKRARSDSPSPKPL